MTPELEAAVKEAVSGFAFAHALDGLEKPIKAVMAAAFRHAAKWHGERKNHFLKKSTIYTPFREEAQEHAASREHFLSLAAELERP